MSIKPEELKPCPFCGDTLPIMRTEHDEDGCVWHYIKCRKCGAKSAGKWVSNSSDTCSIHYAEVRDEWNTRAIPDTHRVVPVDALNRIMELAGVALVYQPFGTKDRQNFDALMAIIEDKP